MQNVYYFVTRRGEQVSIFSLEFFGEDLFLTMIITAGPAKCESYVVSLRAVCLREGIVGFLSQPGSGIITGLVGVFTFLGHAVECWRTPELALADHRWVSATDDMLAHLRKRKDPRIR